MLYWVGFGLGLGRVFPAAACAIRRSFFQPARESGSWKLVRGAKYYMERRPQPRVYSHMMAAGSGGALYSPPVRFAPSLKSGRVLYGVGLGLDWAYISCRSRVRHRHIGAGGCSIARAKGTTERKERNVAELAERSGADCSEGETEPSRPPGVGLV